MISNYKNYTDNNTNNNTKNTDKKSFQIYIENKFCTKLKKK